MAGLICKDLNLLLQRKQTLIVFLGACVLMGFSTEGSFVLGYTTFLSVIMALSTISYDEADNGLPFLMTLPIERKTYAYSKYIFGGIFCTAAWLIAIALMLVLSRIKGISIQAEEVLPIAVPFLVMAVWMLDLMIPLQLKYGAEKSRLVMFVGFGAIAALSVLVLKGMQDVLPVDSALEQLNRIPNGTVLFAAIAGSAVITTVSVLASCHIMNKKVF